MTSINNPNKPDRLHKPAHRPEARAGGDRAATVRPGRFRLLAIGVVALAVVAVILARQFTRPPEATSTLPAEIDAALAAGEPSVFVFTYNGECCPGTEEFFAGYNAAVAEVAGEFGSMLALIWVDLSLMDIPAVSSAVEDLALRYGVTHYPSALILNAASEMVDLFVGLPDAEALRSAIARAVEGE